MSSEKAQRQELLSYQVDRIEAILAAQGLDVRVVGGVVGPRLVVFHSPQRGSSGSSGRTHSPVEWKGQDRR